MGLIEKAAADFARPRARRDDGECAARFRLNFDRLRHEGFFHPDEPSSDLALQLRAVKRRLLRRLGFLRATGERNEFRRPGRQRNLVLVTSTQPGEGKTFCAINLALSFAYEDQIETLLIDADIPRPKVASTLKVPNERGLTDLILEPGADPRAASLRDENAPFAIVTEGRRVQRASDLLASPQCQTLLNNFSDFKRDGLVFLDAPPVLSTTDAVLLAKYVDEIVFVVHANETSEPSVAAALDELLEVTPNVSLVLNRCLVGSGGAHYGSYDYYGPTENPDKEG